MKLTTAIVVLGMAAGSAWAQNPDIIDNTRSTMRAVGMKKTLDTNAALSASQPAAASGAKPAASVPAKAAPAPAPVLTTTASKPAVKAKNAVAVHVTPVKVAAKTASHAKPVAKKKAVVAAKPAEQPQGEVAVKDAKTGDTKDTKKDSKPINLTGRRDPFVSPVVAHSMTGSGCSTGKRCLAIDQIALKGVVRADTGMIAVVVNAVNKAYFLRENDPVFNGYVVKITGDSIIFKETIQDRMGKPFEREVTKKITTPAV
jgi:hypothetical protein